MMRNAMMLMAGLAALSGCGNDSPAPRSPEQAAKDVAMVERMNQPPFSPIRPQPFTPDDIAKYDLHRGCEFRPGSELSEPALFVAQEDRGYIKIDGRLMPLAVKSGSAELPSGAHSSYVGTQNRIELVSQAGAEGEVTQGRKAWPSRLVIHDANERVAYDALGQVRCPASASER